MRICGHGGCDRAYFRGGYCQAHYTRKLRGRPMDAPVQQRTAHLPMKERLALLSRETDTGCRIWTGCLNPDGYGMIWPAGAGRYIGTHRASYEAHFGPIPEGMCVCHRCDVPACINPDHLFLGTNADNVADKGAKGRTPRGEDVARARLTEGDVREIRRRRAAGESGPKIAADFGVTFSAIYSIENGETWRHVQ